MERIWAPRRWTQRLSTVSDAVPPQMRRQMPLPPLLSLSPSSKENPRFVSRALLLCLSLPEEEIWHFPSPNAPLPPPPRAWHPVTPLRDGRPSSGPFLEACFREVSPFRRRKIGALALPASKKVRSLFFVGTVPVSSPKEAPSKNGENGGLLGLSSEEYRDAIGPNASEGEPTVSITVVGASGDLAKKKIFPALFALYYEDCLPKVRCVIMFSMQHFTIFGYARSKMTDAELRTMVSKTLTCRIDKR
ncbi:hypothetical protein B296_00011326 [Ensete ventricosum]|uniref:Glucose-6-phosphate dehydrogenase NAD-binding domain-containing protein n=1 Tax=Ensete ventricosum TaxID=4639 RepID=A0A427A165_ENSVE|nr:hypothetical protein B296_00011326 [Ensete ventricosum]